MILLILVTPPFHMHEKNFNCVFLKMVFEFFKKKEACFYVTRLILSLCLGWMFIHRRVLLPPSLLPLYIYFFFLSIFFSSLHCIPTALTITSSFTVAICWSVPAILINQLRIAYNDLLYLLIYLTNVFRWPFSHLFIYTINTFVVPCLLFVILVLK